MEKISELGNKKWPGFPNYEKFVTKCYKMGGESVVIKFCGRNGTKDFRI